MSHYRFTTFARRPELLGEARQLNGSVWPEFMFHDAVANRLWDRLEGTFADYQTMWLDEAIRWWLSAIRCRWCGMARSSICRSDGMTPSSVRW